MTNTAGNGVSHVPTLYKKRKNQQQSTRKSQEDKFDKVLDFKD